MENYKLPIIIVPSKNAKDQRPYVQYWIYSQQLGRIVRKRVFVLKGKTTKDKMVYAQLMIIPDIVTLLKSGGTLSEPNITSSELHNSLVKDALQFALNKRLVTLGTRAKESYNYHFNIFTSFLQFANLESCTLYNFTSEKATDFQHYIITEKKLSNRSNRNATDSIRTLFNVVIKNPNSPIKTNPFVGLDRLSVGMGKNHAYKLKESTLIIDLAKTRYPAMYLVFMTMYSTLMRTNELCMIQRRHIDMIQPDRIYLPSEDNTKRLYERHIDITKQLKKLFTENGIYELPMDYYLFSRDGCKPGPEILPVKLLGQRYREWILDKIPELKGNRDYTLYSWKHTGVVAAFKAGIKPHDIMKQTGHRNRQSFEVYLKSLGLEENSSFIDNMPEL